MQILIFETDFIFVILVYVQSCYYRDELLNMKDRKKKTVIERVKNYLYLYGGSLNIISPPFSYIPYKAH